MWAIWAGCTSVLTNGIDYAKWMNFHLNDRKDKSGSPLLNTNSFAYLHAPHNLITSTGKYFRQPLVPVTTADTSYAFGWKNGYYRGIQIMFKKVQQNGFAMYIWYTQLPIDSLLLRVIHVFTKLKRSIRFFLFLGVLVFFFLIYFFLSKYFTVWLQQCNLQCIRMLKLLKRN